MAIYLEITPGPGEPAVPAWEITPVAEFVRRVSSACSVTGRPAVVAVDGRSGAGKTTAAELLRSHLPATTVHTDDLAWYESFFGWDELMVNNVLRPLAAGEAVHYRPDTWARRGREGAIAVPEGVAFVIIEGCGAARREFTAYIDFTIWLQADYRRAQRRGVLRDGGTAEAQRFWDEWQAQEVPFFVDQRPWERADAFLCGTPGVEHTGELYVA